MQRLRGRGTTLLGSLAVPDLKRKALNSWAAVQDTYFSTKEIFERHRVVFTVGTSIASVATAWFGYTLRHYHQTKVDQRLESIEKAMKDNYDYQHSDLHKFGAGSSHTAAWAATAGTTFFIGYGLGWRGGRHNAHRKFRREHMKLLGQIEPKRWQLLAKIKPQFLWRPLPQFLGRPLARHQSAENAGKPSERMPKDCTVSVVKASKQTRRDA